METNHWNCCRLCLSVQNLYPIFYQPQHHELYTNALFTVTGVKVEQNDKLPKEICLACINVVNESLQFRRKCKEYTTVLLNRLHNNEFYAMKLEAEDIKPENDIVIKIDMELIEGDFKDNDDNITSGALECDSIKIETTTILNDKITTETDEKKEIKAKEKANTKKCMKRSKGIKIKNNNRTIEDDNKSLKCEHCGKVLTSKWALRNHIKKHTSSDVVCEHCGKKLFQKRQLLMHCRAMHGYEKKDKCSYCDYRGSNAEQVRIHERTHTGEKPYACSQCTATFHRKSCYVQHVAIHLPEKTVQCDQCPARFKSVPLMRIHRNRHRAPVYSFKCLVCDGIFKRRCNVARHLQKLHNVPSEQHNSNIERRKIGNEVEENK